MVQIGRNGIEEFTCSHCGTRYEVSRTPARDSGSEECQVCNRIMIKWVDAAIPIFRSKTSLENLKRHYLFLLNAYAAVG